MTSATLTPALFPRRRTCALALAVAVLAAPFSLAGSASAGETKQTTLCLAYEGISDDAQRLVTQEVVDLLHGAGHLTTLEEWLDGTPTAQDCRDAADPVSSTNYVFLQMRCDQHSCKTNATAQRRTQPARHAEVVGPQVRLVQSAKSALFKAFATKREDKPAPASTPETARPPAPVTPPSTDTVSETESGTSRGRPALYITGYTLFALGYAGQVYGVHSTCDDEGECYYGQKNLAWVPFIGAILAYQRTPKPGSGTFGAFDEDEESTALKMSILATVVQVAGIGIAITGHVLPAGSDSSTAAAKPTFTPTGLHVGCVADQNGSFMTQLTGTLF